MNDHRPPDNTCRKGNNLAKAVDDLTGNTPAQPEHSWLDSVRQSAYRSADYIKSTAQDAPIGTTMVGVGLGIGLLGAAKMAFFEKAVSLGENELIGGGTRMMSGVAAAAERETLAAGGEALGTVPKTMVHLTTREGGVGIANSFKIGSRWGVFALDAGQVPKNGFVRQVASLVPRELSTEIPIGPNASAYFKAPTPVGPFTLARRLAGVKSTPLGSIDLAKDAFIPNEIFSGGVFRQASFGEITKYKVHQWLLDYSIDGLGTMMGGFFMGAHEYDQKTKKCDQNTENNWGPKHKSSHPKQP